MPNGSLAFLDMISSALGAVLLLLVMSSGGGGEELEGLRKELEERRRTLHASLGALQNKQEALAARQEKVYRTDEAVTDARTRGRDIEEEAATVLKSGGSVRDSSFLPYSSSKHRHLVVPQAVTKKLVVVFEIGVPELHAEVARSIAAAPHVEQLTLYGVRGGTQIGEPLVEWTGATGDRATLRRLVAEALDTAESSTAPSLSVVLERVGGEKGTLFVFTSQPLLTAAQVGSLAARGLPPSHVFIGGTASPAEVVTALFPIGSGTGGSVRVLGENTR